MNLHKLESDIQDQAGGGENAAGGPVGRLPGMVKWSDPPGLMY